MAIDGQRHGRDRRPSARQGLAAKIFGYVLPYGRVFCLALVQVFLISAFDLLKPWPIKIIVDHALGGKPLHLGGVEAYLPDLVTLAACGLVAIYGVSGLLVFWHNWTAIGLGQRMVNDLRAKLYAHLQRLSLAYHSRQRVGDLIFRVSHDSFAVQTMIMNGLLPIISATILLGGMLLVLIPLDPLLTAVSLTIVPILFVLIGLFNRKITEAATESRDRDSRVYSLVQWGMGSIKHVQAFTKEEEELARFMQASGHALRSSLRLYAWQTFYSGVIGLLVAIGTAGVLYVGAREVQSGAISIGQLLVFTAYLAQLYDPVNRITQSWKEIAGARVGAVRCFEILDTEPDLVEGTHKAPPSGVRGRVEWRGAAFRYRPETPVLQTISLTVEPGETIALVGATGAGKSTMLGLLPRFFDPSDGDVFLDGVNLKDWSIKSLRSQISMVLQPPLVFPLSVRDNIAYGRPDATEAEIREAARLARIDRLIDSLPDGYDTIVGESGNSFSEGEKQRLTIARALLRDAPILILDEPTSALDTETEALVMQGIDRLMRGRTTFVIAHRLSTVRKADKILVLKDGIIAESGSFEHLMQKGGLFATLYNTQFEPLETNDPGVESDSAVFAKETQRGV